MGPAPGRGRTLLPAGSIRKSAPARARRELPPASLATTSQPVYLPPTRCLYRNPNHPLSASLSQSPPTQGKPDAGQEQPADGATEAPPREPEVKEKSDPEHQNEVEEEDDDEDEDDEDERQLLGEFEKELEGILLPSDRDRLRAEVKAGMERELENIIQEVSSALPPAASAAAHTYGWHRPRGQKRTKSSASAAWGTGQGAPNC